VTSCSAPSSRNRHGVVWPSYPGAAVDLALALLTGVAGAAGLIGDGGAVRHGWGIGEDLVESSSRRFAQGTAASMAATELLHSSENAFAAGLVEGVEKKGWGHENGEQTRE
jgi:hypothetical protein